MTHMPTWAQSFLMMGTVVSVRVVGDAPELEMQHAIERAVLAMRAVEETCSRFDETSALRELCRHPGEWRSVPPILFHTLKIACEMSALTEGVFDPTVGRTLELQGFNRHYLTQTTTDSAIPFDSSVSYRDIAMAEDSSQVCLAKPLLLDLGAVAKGLAVDLAARELGDWPGVAINAGGDIWVAGYSPSGEPWRVGIENPSQPTQMVASLEVSDRAVCTSGSYRRRSPHDEANHHLWDPVLGHSAEGLLSCTVVGPQAVLADVTATAAFLLGPDRALSFIEELELDGLVVKTDGTMERTPSMGRYIHG